MNFSSMSVRRCSSACVPNSLLFTIYTFIHLEIFEVHFDCAGSQNLVGANGCSSRLRSRCDAHKRLEGSALSTLLMMFVGTMGLDLRCPATIAGILSAKVAGLS